MKKIITSVLFVIIVLCAIAVGLISGFNFTAKQLETLKILAIIAGSSALYCFIVGEITGNTSQMDKLWSILPIAYAWVVCAKDDFSIRSLVFAIIVTLWGIRLTINFARKGAYSIRFWEGKEDYRWAILRENKYFQNKFIWAVFNLLFISIYQNFIVLAITLPAVAFMGSSLPFGVIDIIAGVIALGFLVLETVADEYQWRFYTKRGELLQGGKTLSELPSPYNKGFNTMGPWAYMRHPNYLGEQGIWVSLYFFTLGAGVCAFGIFNWSIVGCMLLLLLFMGSSSLGEKITLGKYEEYANYQKTVFKYLPIRKYK